MERVEIFNIITVALTFLALVPKMESQIRPPVVGMPQITPRPICASQFALVNYYCGRLPFNPGVHPEPIPPPDSPPSPDDGNGNDGEEGHRHHHRLGHGHGHRHGHRHRHHQTPDEDNCCRWAKEVDNQCVCELLVRLPPFLVKPVHQYSLTIGEDCEITYSCGAPI